MREAIANAGIFNIILVFVAIIVALFIGSISYSKAFKIKNRIVDIVETYNSGFEGHEKEVEEEVNKFLQTAGYRLNARQKGCPRKDGANNDGMALNDTTNYRYCIYEYSSNRGKYYKVSAFMYLDLPVLGSFFEVEVSGETRVFYGVIDNHKE